MKLLPPNPRLYELPNDWKYVAANKTDIRKTFKRVREKMAADSKAKPNKIRELKRNERLASR